MANVMITGASSGIGLATALELGRAGHTVFATMRSPVRAPQLGEIATRERLPIKICTLDVDSDDSVRVCFAGIGEPIDALVNNAGVERHGCIEELPMEAFLATMNTNYFGAVRCIKAANPHKYLTNMPGNDAGQFMGLMWQAGARPFGYDGKKTVTINLNTPEVAKVIDFWNPLVRDNIIGVD